MNLMLCITLQLISPPRAHGDDNNFQKLKDQELVLINALDSLAVYTIEDLKPHP